MSDDKVKVVQRIWDIYTLGLEQGNTGALATPYDEGLVAVDSTVSPVSDIPGVKSEYVGPDGFAEFTRSWIQDWEGLTMRLVEAVDIGDDRVLAIVRQSATGKLSGAAVELDFGIVYTLEQGLVVDRKDYKLDDARKAAGLSPPR